MTACNNAAGVDDAFAQGRVYISGTGRAGTTFLIQLLTCLGLDTGFTGDELDGIYFDEAKAGYEKTLFDVQGPAIVKSPFLCDHVDDLLKQNYRIQHIIIPVRDFHQAAASRTSVQIRTTGSGDGMPVAGGLWGTQDSSSQKLVLMEKFAKLIESAVRHDIPMTFLAFPRVAEDAAYVFSKLRFLLGDVSHSRFREVFAAVSRPELVHRF